MAEERPMTGPEALVAFFGFIVVCWWIDWLHG